MSKSGADVNHEADYNNGRSDKSNGINDWVDLFADHFFKSNLIVKNKLVVRSRSLITAVMSVAYVLKGL